MQILLYNVQLASALYMRNGQVTRSTCIAEKILNDKSVENIDMIIFLEVFHPGARKILCEKLKEEFPNQVMLPQTGYAFVPGGVAIFSKHPFTDSKCHIYKNKAGADSLASKGLLWVRLEKPIINVIATHAQAWDVHEKVRAAQFAEMRLFIETYVDKTEPIIVAGDFNYDFWDDWRSLGESLPGARFPNVVGDEKYSAARSNQLRGFDGSAKEGSPEKGTCDKEYYCKICWSGGSNYDPDRGFCKLVCPKPTEEKRKEDIFCHCCTEKLLDYAITFDQEEPIEFTLQVLPWKSDKELAFGMWKLPMITRPKIHTRDLSDHYPVLITYEF